MAKAEYSKAVNAVIVIQRAFRRWRWERMLRTRRRSRRRSSKSVTCPPAWKHLLRIFLVLPDRCVCDSGCLAMLAAATSASRAVLRRAKEKWIQATAAEVLRRLGRPMIHEPPEENTLLDQLVMVVASPRTKELLTDYAEHNKVRAPLSCRDVADSSEASNSVRCLAPAPGSCAPTLSSRVSSDIEMSSVQADDKAKVVAINHAPTSVRLTLKLGSLTGRAAFSHVPFLHSILWMTESILMAPKTVDMPQTPVGTMEVWSLAAHGCVCQDAFRED